MVWASRTCLNEILSNVLMFGSIVNWDQKGTFAPIWLIFNNFLETSQASFHWNSQRCNASVYPWPVMVSSFKSKSHSCIQPNVPGSFFHGGLVNSCEDRHKHRWHQVPQAEHVVSQVLLFFASRGGDIFRKLPWKLLKIPPQTELQH